MRASSLSVRDSPNGAERPLRILVVDDDDDSREMIEERLAQIGHTSMGAHDGVDAWDKQRTQPADVILSDWTMPRMDGLELCRLVRADTATDYTYFVFMTGFGDRAHFLEGMRAGADDYMKKPLDLEELDARLLSATRVVAMQRALATRNAALAEESDVSFKAARQDPLTKIANRLQLREDIEALEARTPRTGRKYCAALCDIDHFKRFNDTFGHLAGDEALRRVVGAMTRGLRHGDTLYRYGGEEFLVILPDVTCEEAGRVMERVRAEVEAASAEPGGDEQPLTISAGIADLEERSGECDEWLRRADAALYRAKQRGRNRVEVDSAVGAVSHD